MSFLNLVLIGAGIVVAAIGWTRTRDPLRRYRALQRQDANIARYESWRGGLRDEGQTGASVAMQILRRQARNGAIIIGVGLGLLIAGFGLPPGVLGS